MWLLCRYAFGDSTRNGGSEDEGDRLKFSDLFTHFDDKCWTGMQQCGIERLTVFLDQNYSQIDPLGPFGRGTPLQLPLNWGSRMVNIDKLLTALQVQGDTASETLFSKLSALGRRSDWVAWWSLLQVLAKASTLGSRLIYQLMVQSSQPVDLKLRVQNWVPHAEVTEPLHSEEMLPEAETAPQRNRQLMRYYCASQAQHGQKRMHSLITDGGRCHGLGMLLTVVTNCDGGATWAPAVVASSVDSEPK